MDKALLKAIVTAHLAPGKVFAGKKIKSITPFAGGDLELSNHDENKLYGISLNCTAVPESEPEGQDAVWGLASVVFGHTKHEGEPVAFASAHHDVLKTGGTYMGSFVDIIFRYAKFTNAQGWGCGWVVTLENA